MTTARTTPQIAVAASIAIDHLMSFPGRFADSFVPGKFDALSLSFLVDELHERRGGVAANIAYGMGLLGVRPILAGAVGIDFADYRQWLTEHGVDCRWVHQSATAHTARCTTTTDQDNNQLVVFYSGAMREATQVQLSTIHQECGGLDLVVIGADDIEAMLAHTDECRALGVPFVADTSQQLARLDGPQIRSLIEGAELLISNEYETALLMQKTEWAHGDVLTRVRVWVQTLGAQGIRLEQVGRPTVEVPVVPARQIADPTGVGDGFRAGLLTGWAWGLPLERCAQLGAGVATAVLESVGAQDYELDPQVWLPRLTQAYGPDAATEVAQAWRASVEAG